MKSVDFEIIQLMIKILLKVNEGFAYKKKESLKILSTKRE